MKRVKKGFRMELPRDADITVGVVAGECNGNLVLTQPCVAGSSKLDSVSLSPAQCEALGITAALEDVHSPGRRLYEARRAEAPHGNWTGWEMQSDEERDYHERVAARLGIKPEGE